MHNGDVIVKKPWGQYTDIFRSGEVVFKQIIINAGEEISLQTHNLRDECWFISSGVGYLTIGSQKFFVTAGQSFFINKKTKHQIKNDGPKQLVIFEMQMGLCQEEDIVRYEDKYGRIE